MIWWDEKGRRRPSTIRTLGKGWTGPHNIRVGLGTSEVEGINGRPFMVAGFEWDYGGTATDWKGGALSRVPGGCTLHVVFAPDERAPERALTAVAGDQQFLSNSRSFRAANATILRIGIGYPDRGH